MESIYRWFKLLSLKIFLKFCTAEQVWRIFFREKSCESFNDLNTYSDDMLKELKRAFIKKVSRLTPELSLLKKALTHEHFCNILVLSEKRALWNRLWLIASSSHPRSEEYAQIIEKNPDLLEDIAECFAKHQDNTDKRMVTSEEILDAIAAASIKKAGTLVNHAVRLFLLEWLIRRSAVDSLALRRIESILPELGYLHERTLLPQEIKEALEGRFESNPER